MAIFDEPRSIEAEGQQAATSQQDKPKRGVKVAHCRPDVSHGEAFKAAREAGADEFIWRGERYHTKREDEMPDRPKAPVVTQIVEE